MSQPPPWQPPQMPGQPYQPPGAPYQQGPYQQGPYQPQPAHQQPAPQQPAPQQWAPQPATQDWQPYPGAPAPGGAHPVAPGETPWDHPGPAQPSSGRPVRVGRRALVGAAVAVVLIGGGVATYAAVSSSSGFGGASSPHGAVTSIVSDLNKSDLLGVLDHLPADERTALVTPFKAQISEAKRLKILSSDADLGHVSGVSLNLAGLSFDGNDEQINDHVTVVKLTGGTLTYNTSFSRLPISRDYLAAVGIPAPSSDSQSGTVDIGAAVRERGEPLRIATVKSGGKWYPSLMYTIADNAVHSAKLANPTAADYVAPQGAASAQDAVQQYLNAIAQADIRRLIALTSPNDLAVVHDYGGVILRQAGTPSPPGFTVESLDTRTTSISGGTRVQLKSITVSKNGDKVTVTVDADCLGISANGRSQRFCVADAVAKVNEALRDRGQLTAAEQAALERVLRTVPAIGVATQKVGGTWYVAPVRTLADISTTITSGMQPDDYLTLLRLIRNK